MFRIILVLAANLPRLETLVAEIATRQSTWMSCVWVDSALASLGLTYDRDARKAAFKVADRLDLARLIG